MVIFAILLIIVFLFWPMIMKWIRRFMARRAEDFLRKATGMPPRPGSREERRQNRSRQDDGNGYARDAYSRRTRSQNRQRRNHNEPIIPPEYAEDVEFVETKSYSESTSFSYSDGKSRQYSESQVSDAEWVDIK